MLASSWAQGKAGENGHKLTSRVEVLKGRETVRHSVFVGRTKGVQLGGGVIDEKLSEVKPKVCRR